MPAPTEEKVVSGSDEYREKINKDLKEQREKKRKELEEKFGVENDVDI